MKRTTLYWIFQIAGWGGFTFLQIINNLTDEVFIDVLLGNIALFVFGIVISHSFRALFKRKWANKSAALRVLIAFLATIVEGGLLMVLVAGIVDLLPPHGNSMLDFSKEIPVAAFFNFSVVFFIWNLIYFAVHFFENYRAAEIKNLELNAAKTEIELMTFKNQLNPHFLFNSLNSVRALIDENPVEAKEAVTKLSKILRHFLSLGKESLIPLEQELELVRNYLATEKIRFEERLQINYNIDPLSLNQPIPPFMIQTLVENAIKHGLNKRMDGGTISVQTEVLEGLMSVSVVNTGKIQQNDNSGIGINNTQKRLALLYDGKANFSLSESNGLVIALLKIPVSTKKQPNAIINH